MRTLNSECCYLLNFLPHGEDGLPHIGIRHLIQTYRLDDLTDAKRPNGIGQPVQCVDAANAEEQITPCTETGYPAMRLALRSACFCLSRV